MESKILTHLAVASSESDKFSDSTKKFVKVLDGLQEVYAKSPESIKKEKLALVIVQMNRDLMSYLKNNELGIYKPKATGSQPQAQVPQPQPQRELPFKVGDKFIIVSENRNVPYTIEGIAMGQVTISGFNRAGEQKTIGVGLTECIYNFNSGDWIPYVDTKRKREPKSKQLQPQPQQPQPTKTKEEKIAELKGVIAGLNVLVNRGVEGAKNTVSGLKILLRNLEK